MNSRDFCFWFQGYLELASSNGENTFILCQNQLELIKNKLDSVFTHEVEKFEKTKKYCEIFSLFSYFLFYVVSYFYEVEN